MDESLDTFFSAAERLPEAAPVTVEVESAPESAAGPRFRIQGQDAAGLEELRAHLAAWPPEDTALLFVTNGATYPELAPALSAAIELGFRHIAFAERAPVDAP